MRLFELIAIAANLPYLVWLCGSEAPPPPLLRLMSVLAILSLIVHFAVEGRRWHMIPAYITAILVPFMARRLSGRFRRLSALAIIGLLGTSAVACTVFPVFEFPPLTGPFAVGTTSLRLVDENRPEPTVPSGKRELMIQIWYPAEKVKDAKYALYRSPALTTRTTAHLALVNTRSILDAPISSGKEQFPIVLFSPSVGGNRNDATYLVEELASHGFVVVGIDHTHCVTSVLFPDGRLVHGLARFVDFSSEEMYRESVAHVEADLLVRVGDARFVLDKLVEWNSNDPAGRLTGRLNIHRAGILGHSFGGAVAAETCFRDPRFIAGMNIDGWTFGESRLAGVKQPYFYMTDDTVAPSAADLRSPDPEKQRLVKRLKEGLDELHHTLDQHGGYFLSIRGISHMMFTDLSLFSPVKRYSVPDAGPIDSRRAHRIVNDYTLAFFNKYLHGKAADMQALSAQAYPEVKFESYVSKH